MSAQAGIPFAYVAVLLAFLLELVAGLALVTGYKARAAAAVLIGYVLVLTAIFHLHFDSPIAVGFFVDHLVLIATLMYIAAFGPERLQDK